MRRRPGAAASGRLPGPVPARRGSRDGRGGTGLFDRRAAEYDAWFDSPRGRGLFASEVAALRTLMEDVRPPCLEVGVGTGRFAHALGVTYGVDPAAGALRLARARGIRVAQATGQVLPFPDRTFGGVLIVATLCFAAEPQRLLREAARVAQPGGSVVVGDIPADSPWGRLYLGLGARGHRFYSHAAFYTVAEIEAMLAVAGLRVVAAVSTLRRPPVTEGAPEMRAAFGAGSADQAESPAEEVVPGIVEGAGFVGLLARRVSRL